MPLAAFLDENGVVLHALPRGRIQGGCPLLGNVLVSIRALDTPVDARNPLHNRHTRHRVPRPHPEERHFQPVIHAADVVVLIRGVPCHGVLHLRGALNKAFLKILRQLGGILGHHDDLRTARHAILQDDVDVRHVHSVVEPRDHQPQHERNHEQARRDIPDKSAQILHVVFLLP